MGITSTPKCRKCRNVVGTDNSDTGRECRRCRRAYRAPTFRHCPDTHIECKPHPVEKSRAPRESLMLNVGSPPHIECRSPHEKAEGCPGRSDDRPTRPTTTTHHPAMLNTVETTMAHLYIMFLIILAQLIVVQAILIREILAELSARGTRSAQADAATKMLRRPTATTGPHRPPGVARCSGADSVTIL